MKTRLLILLIALFPFLLNGQDYELNWVKNIANGNSSAGQGITEDSLNNIISFGYFYEDVDLDPSANVLSFSTNGSADIFLQKLDAEGNLIWAKTFGGSDFDIIYSVKTDSNDNIYMVGYFSGTVNFGTNGNINNIVSNGGNDIFVVKLDSDGNFIWGKPFGGLGFDAARSIEIDINDNLYIAGWFEQTVAFDENSNNGNFTSLGSRDSFLLKLDKNGVFDYSKIFGNPNNVSLYNLDVSNNNIYLVGGFKGELDVDPSGGVFNLNSGNYSNGAIIRLNLEGDFIWAKSIGGLEGNDIANNVKVDNEGKIIVSGRIDSSTDFDFSQNNYYAGSAVGEPDIFLLKIDQDANFTWVNTYSSSSTIWFTSLDIDTNNNIFSIGYFYGTAQFGSTTINAKGFGDTTFITNYDKNGNIIWINSYKDFDTGTRGEHLILSEDDKIIANGSFSGSVDFNHSSENETILTSGSGNGFLLNLTKTVNTTPLVTNVSFTGTLEEAQQLSATYDYADTDNDTESGSTYKWYVSDDNSGLNKAAINGATNTTYTLTNADIGKYISFEVSPNDGAAFGTAIESALQGPIQSIFVNTSPTATNVTFSGTLEEAQQLSATYTYADADNDTESGSTYKWYVSDDNAGLNKVAIIGATNQTYTLTNADIGKFISFEVTPNDGTDFGSSFESALQGPIQAIFVNTAPSATNVTFSGTLEEAQQLSATYDYADTDNDAENGSTYRWYVSDDNAGLNKVAIIGATNTTYTLTNADIGKYISFEVTPNDGTDFGTAVESALQGTVQAITIPQTPNNWQTVGIEGFSASGSTHQRLALDSNSVPYVVFRESNHPNIIQKITIMKFNGVNWVDVGNSTFRTQTTSGTDILSIALDNNDVPHVSFWNLDEPGVSVIKFNGIDWEYVGNPVASPINSREQSLKFDSNNTPFLASVSIIPLGFDEKISVNKFDGNNWVLVGAEGFVSGLNVGLDFDNNNIPYVAFQDLNNSNSTSVMKFDSGNWNYVGNAGFSDSSRFDKRFIRMDSNNIPYISFLNDSLDVIVMRYINNNWENVGNTISVGLSLNLDFKIDSNDVLYVVYAADVLNSSLATVKKFNGTNWESVGENGVSSGTSVYNSMAIDNNNILYVGYNDILNNSSTTVKKYNTAPSATNITFTGSLTDTELLSGTYDYVDINSDTENGSTYQWFRSEDANGTNKIAIPNATNTTYTLTSDDENKFISFQVTPNDGNSFGNAVESALQGPVLTVINNPNFVLAPNGVTCQCDNAAIGESGTLTINGVKKTFTKRTQAQLIELFRDGFIDPQIALTCTSGITDMKYLFYGATDFNQDISHWDVSDVTTMYYMFYSAAKFNKDISFWDVSKVTDMTQMFFGATAFNQDIGNWDVSSVEIMSGAFDGASLFNKDIGSWDVSSVTDMNQMFYYATAFNQNLSNWCVSNILTEPNAFDNGSSLTPSNLPVWGACPDITSPTISLIGDNPQIINIGTIYTELGATASDNVDGDISGNIVIDATNVDINTVGSYSVQYNVSDAVGNSATEVTRIVNVIKVPINATADAITLQQNSANNSIPVLNNDNYGFEGIGSIVPLKFTNGSIASTTANGGVLFVGDNGTASDYSDDVVLYSPAVTFTGIDVFEYVITDASGNESTANVTVTVNAAINTLAIPTSQADTAIFAQNSTDNVIDVIDNDDFGSDGAIDNGLTLPNGQISGPSDLGGTVSVDDKGTASPLDDEILYTPKSGFIGLDIFRYMITDTSGDTSISIVTITVTEIDTPTATADGVSVLQDSGATPIDVLANDSFGSDGPGAIPLTLPIAVSDQGGTIVVNAGKVAYTPLGGFSGTDTFEYTIEDATGDVSSGTVTVTVGLVNSNDAPTAQNDAVTVIQNSIDNPISILLNNGSGADDYGSDGPNTNHPIVLSQFYTDHGGKLVLVGDVVNYTPRIGFVGVDTFSYTITDTTGDADRAIVTVTVGEITTPIAAADAATVAQDSGATSIDVLANDSFGADGQGATPLTLALATSTAGGTIVVNAGKVDYTPLTGFSGTDTFEYTIEDGSGDTTSATVTVAVEATVVAASVFIAKADAISVAQNSTTSLNVFADNGSGADSFGAQGALDNGLTLIDGNLSGTSEQGTISIVTNGTPSPLDDVIEYAPNTGFVGVDHFYYMIHDATGATAIAQVTVTVTEQASPTAVADAVTVAQDSGATPIDVLANDSFGLDGAGATPITLPSATSTAGGTIVVNAGKVDYTPLAGFDGTDTFDYIIRDASGDTATAIVTVTVDDANTGDTPSAQDDAVSVLLNSTNNVINILDDNGSGADSFGSDGPIEAHNPISLFGAQTDKGGDIVIVGNTIEYTPKTGFTGIDKFRYRITDKTGDASQAEVTVTITLTKSQEEGGRDSSSFNKEFAVFPNPSKGDINISVFSDKNEQVSMLLFDVTGKVVYRNQHQLSIGKNVIDLNLNVKAGIIFLKVYSKETNYGFKKIVFK